MAFMCGYVSGALIYLLAAGEVHYGNPGLAGIAGMLVVLALFLSIGPTLSEGES